MPSRADLHTHTTYSDGVLTPTQLIDLAYSKGVRILALTDHDTTDGLPEAIEAARKYPDFLLIPGVEMSTDVPGNEVHILGYFIRWQDPNFQEQLARLRDSRVIRARRMVDKLAQLGIRISWERVLEVAGDGSIGRPHIAQVLVEEGYVGSVNEAFQLYLGRNAPAYVEREKLTPAEVVQLLRKVQGICVLAHPRELIAQLDSLLPQLKEVGLVGMEVYYQDYTPEEMEVLLRWARKYDLIPLGGSDYHGLGGPQQREPGDIPLPEEPVQQFLEVAKVQGSFLPA